jgi:hypothetical protein
MPALELTGQRFGRLVALCSSEERRGGSVMWKCQCDCGTTTIVRASYLTFGKSTSCGCYQKERQKAVVTKHNMTKTREYRIWAGIRARCNDENATKWCDYGGRGIKVCDRWSDFTNFYADMGPRPSPQHSIDRIRSSGDYCPENCRWATPREQHNNRVSTRYLSYAGETLSLADWADKLGVPYNTLYSRVFKGWTVDRVLNVPVRTRLKNK